MTALTIDGIECLANGSKTNTDATILLHPEPQMGGDMNHPMLEAIAKEVEKKHYVLRMNLPGVGKTEGVVAEEPGDAERDCVEKVVEHLVQNGVKQVCIMGYSFGALVALSAADLPYVRRVVLVSLPMTKEEALLSRPVLDGGMQAVTPKLLLSGSAEEPICEEWFEKLETKSMMTIEDADQFWGQDGVLDILVEKASYMLTWEAFKCPRAKVYEPLPKEQPPLY